MADHILSYHQSWPWPGQSSPATHGYWPSNQVNVLLFTSLHTPPTKKSTKFTTICLWRKNINIGCCIFFTATLMWLTHHVSNHSLTHSLPPWMGQTQKMIPLLCSIWMELECDANIKSNHHPKKKRLQNATNLQRKTNRNQRNKFLVLPFRPPYPIHDWFPYAKLSVESAQLWKGCFIKIQPS